jgi:DNA invertase Pin-like site-specific DNA recombinase
MCGLIASFAQYERDVLKERTIAGLVAAKRRGKILGRPKQRDDIAIAELRNQGLTIQAIANRLHISKGSVQAALSTCTKNPL